MEIYSPKKFRNPPEIKNEYNAKRKEKMNSDAEIILHHDERPSSVKDEKLADRMKRLFYERLKAFFEYEEVS